MSSLLDYEQVRTQVLQLSESDRSRLLEELRPLAREQATVSDYSRELAWLDENRHLYRGQHLAVSGSALLAHGENPREVLRQVREAGVMHYLMAWVEPEGMMAGGIWE
ncbi:MAG: DUF5678 domain-containing protein [Blastocatellia bacterium]